MASIHSSSDSMHTPFVHDVIFTPTRYAKLKPPNMPPGLVGKITCLFFIPLVNVSMLPRAALAFLYHLGFVYNEMISDFSMHNAFASHIHMHNSKIVMDYYGLDLLNNACDYCSAGVLIYFANHT